jgi:hypothetical protein
MVIVPDLAQFEGLSTDPYKGGAYVMGKVTPYAHIIGAGRRPLGGEALSRVVTETASLGTRVPESSREFRGHDI